MPQRLSDVLAGEWREMDPGGNVGDEDLAERSCPRCADAGYYLVEGRAEPVMCDCQHNRRREGQYQEVGGFSRRRLQRTKFDGLRLDKLSDSEKQHLRKVCHDMKGWAEAPENWIALLGPTGTGKTHLAAAAAAVRLATGDRVFFAVVPALLDELRRTYAREVALSFDEAFGRLQSADLLVLDDFGAHRTSDWAREKLYQLVSYRYLQETPTIVTTNLNPERLRRLDSRLASRIFDQNLTITYELEGPDMRTRTRARPAARTGRDN